MWMTVGVLGLILQPWLEAMDDMCQRVEGLIRLDEVRKEP